MEQHLKVEFLNEKCLELLVCLLAGVVIEFLVSMMLSYVSIDFEKEEATARVGNSYLCRVRVVLKYVSKLYN